MRKYLGLLAVACLTVSGSMIVAEEHEHKMPVTTTSKEFQQMKQLVGVWKGTELEGHMDDKNIQVNYTLTSGGSALVETLTPGTPHEMVSVYADEGGKLGMTHFCMLGNHPRMQLTKAMPNELDFEMKDRGAIGAKEAHMHALTIYFQDNDHIMQRWTSYENGKEKNTVTFKLARAK
jgi:hypothetical protein